VVERWQHPNRRTPESLPVALRRAAPSKLALAWVQEVTGSSVTGVRRLPGASSTAVHQLRLATGVTLVLRAYVWPGFLDDEPEAVAREVDALGWSHRAGLPVPAVVAADTSGRAVGVPAVLMERLPGRPRSRPAVERLAELAAEIHAVNASGFRHQYFPWCRRTSTRPPIGAHRPQVWERAQNLWRERTPDYRPSFIHRDFHPGNVLWSRRSLTGLVDWANACQGPPGVDIATCRSNLTDWADESEAAKFVAAYERLTATDHDPYWDLAALLEDDWDSGKPLADVMRAERRLAAILAACT